MGELGILLVKAVGPALLKLISDHFNNTGVMPTPEELHTQIETHADAIISKGQAWLDAHTTQVENPTSTT